MVPIARHIRNASYYIDTVAMQQGMEVCDGYSDPQLQVCRYTQCVVPAAAAVQCNVLV